MFKNPRLRLLMQVLGFERMSSALDEEIGSAWIIPSRHFAEDLAEYKTLIEKAEFNPPAFDEGETAEDQVRRKTAPRKKAVYDDDDDDDDDINDLLDDGNRTLFPANLKPSKLVGPGDDRLVKKRRLRRRADNGDEGDLSTDEEDEIRTEKARKRRKRDLEKQRKIKSALYVNPSDDESDAEADADFFAREEAIRQRVKKALQFAPTDASQLQEAEVTPQGIADTIKRLMGDSDSEDGESDAAGSPPESQGSSGSRKRKSDALGDDEQTSLTMSRRDVVELKKTRGGFLADSSDEDDDDEMEDPESSSPAGKAGASGDQEEEGEGSDHMETDDTPVSSSSKELSKEAAPTQQRSPLKEKVANSLTHQESDDEEEDGMPVVSKRRPRVRAGFAIDSSEEE
jgi:replication fork protection complex subunit Tof1/Swi1